MTHLSPLSAEVLAFSRLYLAAFFTFVAVFYTARIILIKPQVSSGEVIFPGQRFSASWWNHMLFKSFRAAIWFICVGRLFAPHWDQYLGIIAPLIQPLIQCLGFVLLTVGFAITAVVHWKMGTIWRSGVDPRGPVRLIQTGLYRYSRNPMFVCVALAQLGFFLALPSVFTLVCLVIGWSTLYRQTLVEEHHLEQAFTQEYRHYKTTVRRWV
ncbi:methyltransferase family protein [Motilimonas pumila]|uniref:Isoprenylcysteine carboxylmethyltransferase family protein n=1 Tax=Motilimonas pumila TaxID=2303987 RepID=A0A418YGC0_9GAMM|nr:isoprenylcysteine carboxylmethyltransferase family protein [Motilimonas pumila]RJG48628.1 isoprenylcysteine carboxylmethyltransferase family protein [Motilimonas pumila]